MKNTIVTMTQGIAPNLSSLQAHNVLMGNYSCLPQQTSRKIKQREFLVI